MFPGFHNLISTGIPIDVARAFLTVQIKKTETSPQFVVQTEDKKTVLRGPQPLLHTAYDILQKHLHLWNINFR
ncbi:hypothetical protein DPMN_151517 [Dreissena polymorpha]|uniref:Uncharacterized protein n=1 Tax=Dreissena polymorpha TaxID=45954 RepID=A0A9D4FLC8_DREPO|nr:hypothetical protein DPMN_151517 [Dreissena polymorpha]